MTTDIKTTWDPYLKTGEALENELLAHIRRIYPEAQRVGAHFSGWDIHVPIDVDRTLTIELKRDHKSDDTGNLCFEYEFRGEKSGLATTQADIWVQADPRFFYFFEVRLLKEFLRMNWKHLRHVTGGNNAMSKMVLIRKTDLTNRNFCHSLSRSGFNDHATRLLLSFLGF